MEENDEKIRIERILGLSVTSNAHLDCDSGLIAYPAGNTVVLLDIGSGTVISHIVLETKKPISSIQLKGNSLLFAASDESNFVRVINWQSGVVKDISPCQNVTCCAVSSVLGILVTVGSDRVVSVWDFKGLLTNNSTNSTASTPTRGSTPNGINNNARGRKLASSSVAGKVSCVTFSPDGNYFVTGGSRHLKFWYLQLGKNECVLTGRPAILGSEHSSADFRDIITDGQATYTIANFEGSSATLCQLCPRRFLDKWVQLKTNQAFSMCMDEDLIFIGCADGIIRCFRAGKLDFVATLPLPHHLGVHIAAALDVTALSSHPQGARFPNVVAICAPGGKKVVGVYADHSMYAWDVQDIKRVGLSHSWLWHSGCIWDIAVGKSTSLNSHTNNDVVSLYSWPTFITCSNDDTIRCWDITSQTKSNLYSNECVDIKYISTRYLDSPLIISHGNGVRCVGIGHSFLCCGDRQGNLRLWGEATKNEVIKVKAHKEEILTVDVKGTLVVTGCRDGQINLYNIGVDVERVAILQPHTGSVTCVKFIFSERAASPLFQLVSCGADKNLILRQLLPKKGEPEEFSSEKNFLLALSRGELTTEIDVQVTSIISSKTSLFDLETDANGKHVLVACQDACIRVYNITNGKHSKTLRNSANSQSGTSNVSTFIKLAMDPSGYYVAAAATDKTITVFDYYKGDVVSILFGHSELATALRFTPDFQNICSVGGDSCIFVWTLPREMVVTMKTRMNEKKSRLPPIPPPKPATSSLSSSPASTSPIRADYRFNFGQLPEWAKKQISGDKSVTSPIVPKKPSIALPQGKWSERAEQNAGNLTIKSFYDTDTVVPTPFVKPQASSKEPSADKPLPKRNENIDHLSVPKKKHDIQIQNEAAERSPSKLTGSGIDDEDMPSSDFYSDVNKSTDGEFSDTRQNKSSIQSESDSDESTSTSGTRTSRPAPSKRLIDSFRDTKSAALPYEILRSRNAELIMSVKAKNHEISKSRLELEKRLDATRKKLQSIGYKSLSQSTQDLSHRSFSNDYYLDDSEEHNDENEGMRRACSLSDLNVAPVGSYAPRTPSRKRSFSKHKKSKSSSSGGFDPQNIITRSTSMSALAVSQLPQSDSEPESLPLKPSYMSKTISFQGKTRRKPPVVTSAYSQENLRSEDDSRVRMSTSEQNLFKSTTPKIQGPVSRYKMSDTSVKKPQQIHGVSKGLAVVTGVRQGGREDVPISIELAASSVEALKRSLDQVINLKDRVPSDAVSDQEPIARILDDGLRSVQNFLNESLSFQDLRPKIFSEHEPTVL